MKKETEPQSKRAHYYPRKYQSIPIQGFGGKIPVPGNSMTLIQFIPTRRTERDWLHPPRQNADVMVRCNIAKQCRKRAGSRMRFFWTSQNLPRPIHVNLSGARRSQAMRIFLVTGTIGFELKLTDCFRIPLSTIPRSSSTAVPAVLCAEQDLP